MSKNHLIAGLDIGTGTIKLLVAKEKKEDAGSFLEMVYFVEAPSVGIRKSVVIETSRLDIKNQLICIIWIGIGS